MADLLVDKGSVSWYCKEGYYWRNCFQRLCKYQVRTLCTPSTCDPSTCIRQDLNSEMSPSNSVLPNHIVGDRWSRDDVITASWHILRSYHCSRTPPTCLYPMTESQWKLKMCFLTTCRWWSWKGTTCLLGEKASLADFIQSQCQRRVCPSLMAYRGKLEFSDHE